MSDDSAFDVFVSHAWEDKTSFVEPLVARLIEAGLTVWYDDLSLKLGDSLRDNIDRGLGSSEYGVVVLSPNFFSKQWPQRELNGLVQKAMHEGRTVILPVWHGVTASDVEDYSPPLVDLVAVSSDEGVDKVADRIVARVMHGRAASETGRTGAYASGQASSEMSGSGGTPPEPESSEGGEGVADIVRDRAEYSRLRLDELKSRLQTLPELADFPSLTVFGAGSYARLEASEYSDLDVFFLYAGAKDDLAKPNTRKLRLFGRVIEVAEGMDFPEFSNDCEYLRVLHTDEIRFHLGSRWDDYENYFTARMLLLLESECLYGDATYEAVTEEIISSYFKDYHDHPTTFQPTFLLNDICRFWKTLLLNYENRRNIPVGAGDEAHRQIKAKVRNFKLKYSRMTTCFASIASLGSHLAPVTEADVVRLTRLTPRERLELVVERVPAVSAEVQAVLDRYSWFLEMTGLPTADLEQHFADKQKRIEMFRNANEYGHAMFALLQAIDATNPQLRLLRYLVI